MAEGEWKSTQGDVFRFEKANDELVGKLAQVRDGNYFRPDGGKSKVYDITTPTGTKTIFGTMILERQMGAVQVGQEVKVVYLGEVTTKSGRQAKNFSVFTK